MTGRALERLRKENNISRASFSRWCGVDYSTARKWERPGDRPAPLRAYRLLVAYVAKVKAERQEACHAADKTA